MKFHCTSCEQPIEKVKESSGQYKGSSGQYIVCPRCKATVQAPQGQAAKISEQPQISSARDTSQRTQSFFYRRIFLLILLIGLACFLFICYTAFQSILQTDLSLTASKNLLTSLLTTVVLGVYGVTGLCCTTVIDHPQHHRIGQMGIMMSMIGSLWAFGRNVMLMSNLEDLSGGEGLRFRFAFLVITVAFAHSALLLNIKTTNAAVQNLRYLTLGIIATFSVILVHFILVQNNIYSPHWELLWVLALLNMLGTLATCILAAST